MGEQVARGEYLGLVGSSGFSTGPHLHLEIRKQGGAFVDPFAGPFNPTTETSWWLNQEPYRLPRVNRLMTHLAPPRFGQCEDEEHSFSRDYFLPNQTAYFGAFFRDFAGFVTSYYTISIPNGSPVYTWDFAHIDQTFSAFFVYWKLTLASNAPKGIWTFAAEFEGQRVEHYFAVGELGPPEIVELDADSLAVPPGVPVTLSWRTADATRVYFEGDPFTSSIHGSRTVHPKESTEYTLVAEGPEGSVSAEVFVAVTGEDSDRMLGHVTPDNGAFLTDFIVANTGSTHASYTFLPFGADGERLEPVSREVDASRTQHWNKLNLFGDAPVSHFLILAPETVVVSAAYRAAAGGSPAHLTETSATAHSWRLYPGDWDYVWDGFAVVNRGDTTATVTVDQLDGFGKPIPGSQRQSLAPIEPLGKGLAVLSALGFDPKPGTHFRINANQPISLTALRGQLGESSFLWENRAIPDSQ